MLSSLSVPHLLGFFPWPNLSFHLHSPAGGCPLLGFFPCSNQSIHVHSPEGEFPSVIRILFMFWLVYLVSTLQRVSPPCFLRSLLCPDLFSHLHSPGSKLHLTCSDFLYILAHLSAFAPQEVSVLTCLDSYYVLTCLSILQLVSAPHSLRFLLCSDLSICQCSPVGECPLLA